MTLLARQPIMESSWQVHGYELLFRNPDGSSTPVEDESAATAQVVVGAFADLSLGAVTSGARAWINIPRRFLLDTDIAAVLPKERVVLELLERDVVDEAMVARARELTRLGYQIALDDFVWSDAMSPLVDLATYVKLDVRDLGLAGVREQAARLHASNVRLVAEKIETETEFKVCVGLGIGLHQGYYFERPQLVKGRPTPHHAIAKLHAAASLAGDSSFEEIESFLRRDPGMSLRLLRYIGSAAVGLRHRVTSLNQALALVGANTVRQWLYLVLLSDAGQGRPEILRTGLVRAKLCESLAPSLRVRAEPAFVVGLFSVADALFDVELRELVDALPLADDLRAAIVDREGPLGLVLQEAIEIQHGRATGPGHDAHAVFDAIRWADSQTASLVEAGG